MSTQHYVACDLGAESGRVMLGRLVGDRLTLEEIHRFPNGPVEVCGTLRWDVLRLFDELKTGLHKIAARGIQVSSVSCDSWGVDYVLLGGNEPMLTAPFHYRDTRTDGGLEEAFAVVPADEIFVETGIQFMPFNTLYQLLADVQQRSAILRVVERFLNIGDYFNFLLSGVARAEESIASTSQIYNPQQRRWSKKLIAEFGLPGRIFPEIVPSGTILGPLLPTVSKDTGLIGAEVVASCSHDTAAAVAAIPAVGESWAYLSSGTWSIIGVESPTPIIDAKSREYNFTNEVGYGGSIRFLKNIPGLWIVQKYRRALARGGREFTYEQLTEMAEAAPPLASFIDLMDPSLGTLDDMPGRIAAACRATNQPVPATPGEIVRCVLESLALLYRRTFSQLEEVTGRTLSILHIVGGGSKNLLLNQLTANSTGRVVLAGPTECSAIGNVLVQAIALGHIPSLTAAREIVRASFPVVRYEPADAMLWENVGKQFHMPAHG